MYWNFSLRISTLDKLNLVSPFISFACPKETKQRKGQPVQSFLAQTSAHPAGQAHHRARTCLLMTYKRRLYFKPMKICITLCCLFFLLTQVAQAQYDTQIKGITQELSKKIGETGKKRIAVADFTDAEGSVTKLGQFLSEEFNTTLPEVGQGFEVIDRSRVNILLRENKISTGGLTDPSNALKLGKLAGIEALIYGTITPFGESVRVNIKILDLQRGVILRSVAGNITRTADINRLLSETIANTPTGGDPLAETPTSTGKKSSTDCEEKRTCTICVTNKSDISIETSSYHGFEGYQNGLIKLIHPNATEC
jgi:TolB-like protein